MNHYCNIDYSLPCISTKLNYLIREDDKLPYIAETLLRHLKLLGTTDIKYLKNLLALDTDELKYLIRYSKSNDLINVDGSFVKLSQYSESLFLQNNSIPRISKTEEYYNLSYNFNTVTNDASPYPKTHIPTLGFTDSNIKFTTDQLEESFQRSFNINDRRWIEFRHSQNADLIGLTKSSLLSYYTLPISVDYYVKLNNGKIDSVFEDTSSVDRFKLGKVFNEGIINNIKQIRTGLLKKVNTRYNLNSKNFLKKFSIIELDKLIGKDFKINFSKIVNTNNYSIEITQPNLCDKDWTDENVITHIDDSKNPVFYNFPVQLPYFALSRRFERFFTYLKDSVGEKLVPIHKLYTLKKIRLSSSINYNKHTSFLEYVEIISQYNNVGIVTLHLPIKDNFPFLPITIVFKNKTLINLLHDVLVAELNGKSDKLDLNKDQLLGSNLVNVRVIKTIFKKLTFW
jgi:hypothetical protein